MSPSGRSIPCKNRGHAQYSLGVLLYELLTGHTPFRLETLRKAGLDEMRRIIREEEPPPPSHRVSTLAADAGSTVSERRGADPRRLNRTLRGELDWIVMKAIEKDRTRRYESASAFAADIERYLSNSPVEACPPSPIYRLRKAVRRNRVVIAMASVVTFSLLGATVVSIWQAAQARQARHQAEVDRDLAKKAQSQAEGAEHRATAEAAIAQAVNDFLQKDLLLQASVEAQNDQGFAEDPNLTVKDALNRAAIKIRQRFQGQPLVEAALRSVIGETYMRLGERYSASEHVERALELRETHLGCDQPDTLASMDQLANLYRRIDRLPDAISLCDKMVSIKTNVLGPDHPRTLDTIALLAEFCQFAGQLDKAWTLHEGALEKRKLRLGPTHQATLTSMHFLAVNYMYLGEIDDSLALHSRTLELCRAELGSGNEKTITVMRTFAEACQKAEKLDDADRLLCEALDKEGPGVRGDVGRAHTLTALARNLFMQKRFAEAELAARQAHALYSKHRTTHSGPDDIRAFCAMSLVGGALMGLEKHTEAERLLLEGYEGMKERKWLLGAGMPGAPNMWWLNEALERIILFYETTDQPEKAAQWRQERFDN